jgi:hypothetical protein
MTRSANKPDGTVMRVTQFEYHSSHRLALMKVLAQARLDWIGAGRNRSAPAESGEGKQQCSSPESLLCSRPTPLHSLLFIHSVLLISHPRSTSISIFRTFYVPSSLPEMMSQNDQANVVDLSSKIRGTTPPFPFHFLTQILSQQSSHPDEIHLSFSQSSASSKRALCRQENQVSLHHWLRPIVTAAAESLNNRLTTS